MFLSKLPDELPANRRMARELVQRWSRPIFEAYRNDRCGGSGCPPSSTTKGSMTGTRLSDRSTHYKQSTLQADAVASAAVDADAEH